MDGNSETQRSSLTACQILAAMRRGSIGDLESGLEQAEQLASNREVRETVDGEQIELLGAVAVQMRRSINRFGRRLSPHLEGIEVHLRLLRHLARTAPGALASPRESLGFPLS